MSKIKRQPKSANILCWVFFASKGIIDNADLMRCMMLCEEICHQGIIATVSSIKASSAFLSCIHDIPDSYLNDDKIQEMILWK